MNVNEDIKNRLIAEQLKAYEECYDYFLIPLAKPIIQTSRNIATQGPKII